MLLLVSIPTTVIHAQGIHEVNVSIQVSEARVGEVLQEIESATPFAFAYQENLMDNVSNRLTIDAQDESVAQVLDSISHQTALDFKQINDHTIAVRQSSEKPRVQQQTHIRGTVTDAAGVPLAGATVVEKGTANGVSADFDGIYSIRVSQPDAVLVFSFVGYQTQEISVNNQTILNVQLNEDTAQLDEIVVIGYGTQNQRKLTGAISKAPIGDLQDFPVSNFDQALAGKVAGVQVLQTTGQPGRELDIRVRGTGTITAGVQPLYVVDGVPLDSPGQATEVVSMEDIESIQILKDASSAAIYGSRGANGVVLITTKKGKQGKMKVSFNQSVGFQSVSKTIDMMDAYEYAQLSRDGHNAAYLQETPTGSPDDPNDIRPTGYHKIPEELFPYLNGEAGLTNTDWQDAIFRTAMITRYNLAINGGNEKLNYYVSANHSSQEGIIIHSDYRKTGLRANLGIKSGKFNIGLNLSPSYTFENRVNASGPYFDDGIVASALKMSPTWSVFNEDGSYNFLGNGFWRIGTDFQHNEILNPVAVANEIHNEIEHYNLLSNLFVEYELIEGLKLKSSFAINYNAYQNEFYRPSSLQKRGAANFNEPAFPEARLSNTNIYNWLWENTVNYKVDFGKHSFDVLGGITAQKDKRKSLRNGATISGIPVQNSFHVVGLAGNDNLNRAIGVQEWSLYSLLARVQYDYDSKYLLSASFRGDAASRFAPNNKWGYFPSVSAGWRISQEDFLADSNVVSELKLRASYGLTGNFQIPNYGFNSSLDDDNYVLGNPGQEEVGLRPDGLENPDLSWEKTAMFNAGLDLELFNNQIGLTLDYYNSNTSDLLLEVPIPQTTGFGSTLQNIGEVNNKGYEAALRISPDLGEFKWTGNFNISINRNEVKALGPENTDIITTAGTGHAFFITRVGEQIGSYYLLVQDGIFANEEQLSQYPHFGSTRAGDFRFVDVNGDGVLDVNDDRTIVGNYAPDFTYGFSSIFNYKGLDLNVAFQGSYGGEILNLQRRYIANSEGNFNNMRIMLDRWQSSDNPGNLQINRANRKSRGNNGRTSTWHIEDGSYLRLQNVSLGYSLPRSVLDKLNISKLRLFVSGNNLYTWTDYTGYNPEVNLRDDNQLTPGLDYGTYPLAKTYSFGMNLSF